jgi:hypothetical protein
MNQATMTLSHPMFADSKPMTGHGLADGCVAQLVAWIAANRGASTG